MRTTTLFPITLSLIAGLGSVSARPVSEGTEIAGDWRGEQLDVNGFNSTAAYRAPRGNRKLGDAKLRKRGGAYDADVEAVVVGAPTPGLIAAVSSGTSIVQLATSSIPTAVSTSRAQQQAASVPVAQAAQVTQAATTSAAATTTTTSSKTTTTTTTTSTTTTSSAASASFTGKATFFYQDSEGACGHWNDDSVKLVALDSRLYGDMDAVSPYCGKSLTITNTANGKSVQAVVMDACPGCSSKYSLDLSTGAFDAIGDEDTGILPITWYWN